MIIYLDNVTVKSLIEELSKLDGDLPVEVPLEGSPYGTDQVCIYVDNNSVCIGE